MNALKDRIDIADLVAAFSAAANRKSADEMKKTFAPDIVLGGVARMSGLDQDEVVGTDAVAGLFAAAFSRIDMVHQIGQTGAVTVEGDRAHCSTTVTEIIRADGGNILLAARYDDQFVRLDEGWRFARRDLVVSYYGPIGG